MIYINPNQIIIPQDWKERVKELTQELLQKSKSQRNKFIDSKRTETWGHPEILTALKGPVGNKCWYTEVDLTGSDPNIDHFRPKGKITEIDVDNLVKTKKVSDGYWWLAFDSDNFRLSSMHANQRRVDEKTNGGKWDFFPVDGPRAIAGTQIGLINESILPFDPCSPTDVALMWFEPDGKPGFKNWRRSPTIQEERRLKVTTWLFHLDKQELAFNRAGAMEEVRIALKNADAIYQLWEQKGFAGDGQEKNLFDRAIAGIRALISDKSPFAGAKRCAVQMAKSDYLWMVEYF